MKEYKLKDKLDFGKFHGKLVEELLFPSYEHLDIKLRDYLREFISALVTENNTHDVPMPYLNIGGFGRHDLTSDLLHVIEQAKKKDLGIVIGDGYIVNGNRSEAELFNEFIDIFRRFDFQVDLQLIDKPGDLGVYSSNTMSLWSLQPQSDYLKWLVNEHNSFVLNEEFFDQNYSIKNGKLLKGLKINRLGDDVLEYTPVFKTYLIPLDYILKLQSDNDNKSDRLGSVEKYSDYNDGYYTENEDPWVEAFDDHANDAYWNCE